MTDAAGEGFVPFPETPKLVDARIAAHPDGGRDCLLATTEDGRRLAASVSPTPILAGTQGALRG